MKILKCTLGAFLLFMLIVNTCVFCLPIMVVSLFRYVPINAVKTCVRSLVMAIACCWVGFNGLFVRFFLPTQWDVSLPESLSHRQWYLVIANHQTWLDIVVLQLVFQKKIPFLKFVAKASLNWVPLLGSAWRALEMPFMKRYSKEQIEKNPALRLKDLQTMRAKCSSFSTVPTTLVTFVEGTRFTPKKHCSTQSPYRSLLKPRAGGMMFGIKYMSEYLDDVLDVSIVYSKEAPTLWQFMCGDISRVCVDVQSIKKQLPLSSCADQSGDEGKDEFCSWLNDYWSIKDERIGKMQAELRS